MAILTIHRLGHHGDGIAPGPIFVPRTLPGEVVEGDIEGTAMVNPKIVARMMPRIETVRVFSRPTQNTRP